MQLSLTRNFDTETTQQKEAHRKARRVRLDVEMVAAALTQADNTKADGNPARDQVNVSDTYIRHHEAFGYNHFSAVSANMASQDGKLQTLEAQGVHRYEWLELSPPACRPYEMGKFDVSFRREGEDEVYRSGETTIRLNATRGTLAINE